MHSIPVYYSDDYVLARADFDTTRKAKYIANSLSQRPIEAIVLQTPTALTAKQLAQVHAPAYVEAIRTGTPRGLAESQGFDWDANFWTMVCASNGGVLDAARAALRQGVAGSLSSGLHHARRDRGAGFCTFNGLAIAAHELVAAGADSILILDLDAHCGGGTHSLIADNTHLFQLDISVSAYDHYVPSDRTRLDVLDDADDYLAMIRRRLAELSHWAPKFDLCLYNAGMDPDEGCDVGGLAGITQEMLAARERLVFTWAQEQGIPIAFVLAGGYIGKRLSWPELVNLHRLTLAAAADCHISKRT